MTVYHILYWVYFTLASFSVGSMAFAGFLNAVSIKKFELGFNSVACFRVLMSLGYCLVVGTLLWLTIPAAKAGIHPSVEYWFYTAGLIFASVGALGLAFKNISIQVRMESNDTDEYDLS
jgi:hypothetical protein